MVQLEEKYKVILREPARSRLLYGIGFEEIGPKIMEFICGAIAQDEQPTPEWAYRTDRSDWTGAAREFNEWRGYEAVSWEPV